jgi:cell wall-associated NlpC family hydrolase
VPDTTHSLDLPVSGGRRRPSRATALLAPGIVVLAVVGMAAAGAAGGGGRHARTSAHGVTRAGTAAGATPANSHQVGGSAAVATAGAAAGASGARAKVAEVADPQEASSFPVPASVRHKAAAAPATAGAAIVAPGAPSNAEVRQELAQMQAAEHAATATQQRQLTPVPGGESIGGNGTIPIAQNVPEVVQRVIAGANEIADFPYVFGGGHGSFVDNAYDCSGSVSYALAAGGLLSSPQTSGELESWGVPGPGRYITVFANAGHTYMYVDGILYDTAGRSGPYTSRWQVIPTDNAGYVERHWPGL